MKRTVAIVLFSSAYLLSTAQNLGKIDSLLISLDKDISDKERVDIYVDITDEYSLGDSMLTLTYGNQAISLAEQIGYPEGKLDALYQIGWMFKTIKNYSEAERAFRQLADEADNIGYRKGQSRGFYGLARIFDEQYQNEEAFNYYSKSLQVAREDGDEIRVSSCLTNMGIIHKNRGDYEEAIKCYLESINIEDKLGNKWDVARGYNNIANVYKRMGQYPKTVEYYLKSIELKKEIGNKKGLALSINNLASTYSDQGNYSSALEQHFKSLSISKEIGDKSGEGGSYNNIGSVYKNQEEYEKALEYYNLALDIAKELDEKDQVARVYNNVGIVYNNMGNLVKALHYYELALEMDKRMGNHYGEAITLYNIGAIYGDELKNESLALYYLSESEKLSKSVGASNSQAFALNAKGEIYINQRKWLLARSSLTKALQIGQSKGWAISVREATGKLARVEKELGNYKAAYEAHVMYKEMADSLFNEEQTQKLTRLEANYEFKQEKDSIQFANENVQLSLEADLERRKGIQTASLIGLALSIIIVLIVIFFYRKLKKLNVEVVGQRDSLEKLNRTKDKFFSIIAHDLRGPLIGLQGIGQKLEYFIKSEKLEKLLEVGGKIDESVHNVNQLLNNLLNWAISESGDLPYNPEQINSADLVRENIELYRNSAQSKQIDFQVSLKELPIYADVNSVSTVIRNVLGNAVKFTKKGGVIRICLEEKGEDIQILIEDEGPGLNKDKLDNLFDSSNLSVPGSSGEKGVGLGLRLSKEFISLNGGSISVQNRESEGAMFTISIPKRAPQAELKVA